MFEKSLDEKKDELSYQNWLVIHFEARFGVNFRLGLIFFNVYISGHLKENYFVNWIGYWLISREFEIRGSLDWFKLIRDHVHVHWLSIHLLNWDLGMVFGIGNNLHLDFLSWYLSLCKKRISIQLDFGYYISWLNWFSQRFHG